MATTKITNTAAGPRGVNLKDGTTVFVDPGQAADVEGEIAGDLYEGLVKGDGGLDSMSKAELRTHMDERGIAYETDDNKADLLRKIEEANAAQ